MAGRVRRDQVPDVAVHDCDAWLVFPDRVCLRCAWRVKQLRRQARRPHGTLGRRPGGEQ